MMLCAAVLLLVSLTSCARRDSTSSGAGHSFFYALAGNPDTLDPQLAQNDSAKIVLCNLFEGLFVIGADGSVENGVAESYTVSEDGLTYTIQLREDSYWYCATDDPDEEIAAVLEAPVNAMDFVYAFQRLFDPLYHSPYRSMYRCISHADAIINDQEDPSMIGVYAKKTYELEIRLAYAEPDLPRLLAQSPAMPCRQAYFELCKGRYGLDEESVCGNGAFAMKRWLYDPYGSHNVIQLCRNASNHAVDRVYPVDLTFYIENSVAETERLYSAGVLDCLMTCNSSLAAQNKGTVQGVFCRTLSLTANPDSPYANALIRQAFAYTVDFTTLSDMPEDVQVAYGLLPPDVKLLNKSCRELISENGYRTTDSEMAKTAFAQGLEQLGVEELPEGKIMVPTGWIDDTVLLALMQQWKDTLGVYLSLDVVSEEDYAARLVKGDYVLSIVAIEGDDPSPDAVFRDYLSHPAIDFENMAQDTMKLYALLEQAEAAENLNDRVELYRLAEQQVIQDMLFLPLFYTQRYLLCRENIADVQFDPFGGLLQFSEAKCFD